MLNENTSYYEILELKPDASPHQIREAYLKAKATYQKDSTALYSLISTEEREEQIQLIEEAYRILSSPQMRREYDHQHSLVEDSDPRFSLNPSSHDFFQKIQTHAQHSVSPLKRIASPFEDGHGSEDLLIPPSTETPTQKQNHASSSSEKLLSPSLKLSAQPAKEKPSLELLKKEIETELEWTGAFLKKVREMNGISLEEISNITKINKSYLFAIEDENFTKLPAAVFVRGFIIQLAKVYRLPTDKVVQAYLGRLNIVREQKKR